MGHPKSSAASADWTHLLTDPDLAKNLGKLLQIYRDTAPEQREQALLEAMKAIKNGAIGQPSDPQARAAGAPAAASLSSTLAAQAVAPAPTSPPFEPDLFTPSSAQDRRKYPRHRCFVAVELHVEGSLVPLWGNLSNTSLGGCFVESSSPIVAGANVKIGLWVSSGKIWVKGIVLNGVVTESTSSFGIRIKFRELEVNERESLRQFLKFVENTTQCYYREHGYLAQLKR